MFEFRSQNSKRANHLQVEQCDSGMNVSACENDLLHPPRSDRKEGRGKVHRDGAPQHQRGRHDQGGGDD